MAGTKIYLVGTLAIVLLVVITPAKASLVSLPAVYPLVNVILPMLKSIYNLMLSLLSILDTLPSSIACTLPVDVPTLKTGLLKLYSQALGIVEFFSSLPEYSKDGNVSLGGLVGLLNNVVGLIGGLSEELLTGLGGGLLVGLLEIVVCLVKALLVLLV